MSEVKVPTYDTFMNPLLQALKELGGSGTIEEIATKTAEIVGLSDEQLEIIHDPKRGSSTEFEYRLAWTRTYLKKYGLLENSSRGVWALTQEGRQVNQVDSNEVKRFVREEYSGPKEEEVELVDEEEDELTWREELAEVLLKMEPSAFERLAQRLLRESGFIQVEVTGRSGDAGIDGKENNAFRWASQFSCYLSM
jgi:restriction system protein